MKTDEIKRGEVRKNRYRYEGESELGLKAVKILCTSQRGLEAVKVHCASFDGFDVVLGEKFLGIDALSKE